MSEPTYMQREALRTLAGRSTAGYRINGRTMAVLVREGWVVNGKLTDAGHALLGELGAKIAHNMEKASGAVPTGACTFDVSDPSHGPMSCDNETEPGSEFCSAHLEMVQRLQVLSDDMDRLEAGTGAAPGSTYNPETDRYERPDGAEDPYRRHLRRIEETSGPAFWGA